MLSKERQAECQSKIIVNVNEKQVEMKFRYFSPSQDQNVDKSKLIQKIQRSQQLNIISQIPSPSSSSIRGELIIRDHFIENRRDLNPKKQSNKFYQEKISEINHCLADYYEKFHTKLLIRARATQKSTSKRKLEVTSKSKQKDQQRSYVKRIKINLFQTHQKASKEKTRSDKENDCNFEQTKKHNIHHSQEILAKDEAFLKQSKGSEIRRQRNSFVIKLYEDRKCSTQKLNNVNEDQFRTPRRTYSRKGITVYSSTSLKKHSTGQKYTISMNTIPNISTNNEQKIESIPINKLNDRKRSKSIKKKELKDNEMAKRGLRQRYGTQYVEELKKRAQQTKKRVYSKSKIEKKTNPLIRRK